MNLSLRYFGPYNKVKILSYKGENDSNRSPLDIGKIYEVIHIEKCLGKFKCARHCTSGLRAVIVKLHDEGKEIAVSTCGYELGTVSGLPLCFSE